MSHPSKSHVDHVAIHVRDIGWHIRFFRDVLGMVIRETDGPGEAPHQIWFIGGVQLIADPSFAGPEGRLAHLGVQTDDLDSVLREAQAWGVRELPQGRNWLALPDGLAVELLPTAPTTNATKKPPIERYYDDARVGDACTSPSLTVTEAHIMTYADLTGDHTPVHTDEAYARTTPFGTRVAHGLLGLSLTDGLKTQADYRFVPGMSLGWTWDFAAPIKIGDTVHVTFRVASMRTTSRPGWGIVVLPSELINQNGDVVQRGEHRLMIPMRPAATPA